MELNKEIAAKVLKTVDAGLVSGLGKPIPGQMCVEAAVCYAMGMEHSDEPKCVGSAVRSFKIRLNDSNWPDDETRTKGMRKLAIAQLGSDTVNQMQFAKHVALECQKRILPVAIRYAASTWPADSEWPAQLEEAALLCEKSTTLEEANAATINARLVTSKSRANANAYAYADANANAYVRLRCLHLLAEIGLEALIACKSPGCEWLDLCD